jgi:hypothetical protein
MPQWKLGFPRRGLDPWDAENAPSAPQGNRLTPKKSDAINIEI